MTKAQFYDVLCNPDGYIGCDIVVCSGAPCVRRGKIFYTTLDTFVYEYTDFFGNVCYGTINIDNYILCQFVHLHSSNKVL